MTTYLPAATYAAAGVRRVLVATHAAGTRFVFDPALPLITSLIPTPPAWYALTAEPTANATQAGSLTLSGLRYDQRLSLSWTTTWTLYQRLAVPQLFDKRLYVVFEDMAGNWWLAGQARGLRCASLTWQSGQRLGDLSVSAALEGVEREPWSGFDTASALALYAAAVAAATPPGGGGSGGGGILDPPPAGE